MRIAYVCADAGIPVFGTKGASVHVQGVIGAMVRAGHEVTLVAARLGGLPPAGWESVRVVPVEPPPAPTVEGRERVLLALNDRLRAALADGGPFDLVYERYSLWGHAGMAHARAAGIPGVLEVNAPLIDEQRTHRQLHDVAGAEWVAAQAFGSASLLVAVSQPVANYLQRQRSRTAPVLVVPNGIDPARFPVAAYHVPRRARPFTVGFLGTLKPWHGLPELVEAFAALRAHAWDARLLVIGDGPDRQALEDDLARRRLTSATTITGAVAPHEVGTLLTRVDVALAPYPGGAESYFSPLKVVEYLAAGLPVVASRCGQLPELVRHGVTGLLVTPGNAEAMASACNRLRLDRTLALGMAREGRREVLATRTWDAALRRILTEAHEKRTPVTSMLRPGAADALGVVA